MSEPTDTTSDDQPFVSVVIPMFNESRAIATCIESFDSQTYPSSRFEVIIVDGESTDDSRDIVEKLQTTRPWLRLVSNPDRRASSAFNRGIEASDAPVVAIVGAHATVGPDFLSRSIATLQKSGAAGVGGVLLHQGLDSKGTAIGLAMISKLGMASPFRYATEQREVDTIGHPVYWRNVLDEVGHFNETLERNSDYELNYRIRAAGHTLILDPEIVTVYHPRDTLGGLAKQFYNYGLGKAAVVQMHPGSLAPRHLVAPAAALIAAVVPLLIWFRSGRRLLTVLGALYAGAIVAATIQARPGDKGGDTWTFMGSFPVMHLPWGSGFLIGTLRRLRGR